MVRDGNFFEISFMIETLKGLFVAGVFSGALSTVSSGLNSLAAVTLQVTFNNALSKPSFLNQSVAGLCHGPLWSQTERALEVVVSQGVRSFIRHYQFWNRFRS